MDLTQSKLNKTEWNSIEVPISQKERHIVSMIMNGYDNINIKENHNQSLASFMRMTNVQGVHDYVYVNYFDNVIKTIDEFIAPQVSDKKIKKGDKMKLDLNKKEKLENVDYFEKKLIDTMKNLTSCLIEENNTTTFNSTSRFHLYYVSLHKLLTLHVEDINIYVLEFAKNILEKYINLVNLADIFTYAQTILEKNKLIIDNADISLYQHQKDIFRTLQNPDFENRQNLFIQVSKDMKNLDENDDYDYIQSVKTTHTELITPTKSKLVLYSAPTGTGKTLTPIALAKSYKILFVCAARHVGLALAKNSISLGRKVAFAFGCETADDIRLHYSAASVFTRNKITGGISKVDNSVGDKVEIMICDIKSYLYAMNYMIAFNPIDNLLMYWDEPTISMDYEEHALHDLVKTMWKGNIVPNIVLSSATLPSLDELQNGVIFNFHQKFETTENVNIINIQSHDSKKSIPIIDRQGFNVAPHFLKECEEYDTMKTVIQHCENNKTLLRYIDLQACIDLINMAIQNNYVPLRFTINRVFGDINDITITSIKEYYLKVIKNVISSTWGALIINLKISRKQKLVSNHAVDSTGNRMRKIRSVGPGITPSSKSAFQPPLAGKLLERTQSIATSVALPPAPEENPGSYITTKDAETLTDGPTIFIAEDVEKIAKFYLKQSYIPASVLVNIMEGIEHNNKLSEKIAELDAKIEVAEENQNTDKYDDDGKGGKGGRSNRPKNTKRLNRECSNDSKGNSVKIKNLREELSAIHRSIKSVNLSDVFVPNKSAHIDRWASNTDVKNAFSCNVSDEDVRDIMAVDGVSDIWKILLLMGIGVFANHNSLAYTEIMKKMATEQRLYLIIASSDYIYGTNYQFCHGYLGKDVILTQQKMLQALGRIGRHNDQKEYSVRLRENKHSQLLFMPNNNIIEAQNMNRLFVNV